MRRPLLLHKGLRQTSPSSDRCCAGSVVVRYSSLRKTRKTGMAIEAESVGPWRSPCQFTYRAAWITGRRPRPREGCFEPGRQANRFDPSRVQADGWLTSEVIESGDRRRTALGMHLQTHLGLLARLTFSVCCARACNCDCP
jgi:hypothetical protein